MEKELITADQFLYHLFNNDKDVSGIKVEEVITIKKSDFISKPKLLEIRYCDLDILSIDIVQMEVDTAKDLNFIVDNCKINKLYINNLNFNTLRIENTAINRISLTDCKIQSIYFFKNEVNHLSISANEIVKTNFSSSKVENFEVEDNITKEDLSLFEVESKKIYIKDHQSKISVSHCEFEELTIEQIGHFLTEVFLGNCKGKKMETRNSTQRISYIHMVRCEIDQIKFGIINANSIYLDGLTSAIMSFTGEVYEYLKIYRSTIGNLVLNGLNQSKNEFSIHASTIKHLYLQRITRDENSITTLNEVEIEDNIFLEDSYLPKIRLNNIDMSNARIHLRNTVLTGSEFINIRWKNYEVDERSKKVFKATKDKVSFLWSIKEQYRQLKVLSINQHNKIDAINFQRNELRVYLNLITLLTWRKGIKSWGRNIGNWLVLITNKIFSDFGQSWILPLMWWLVFHGFLFSFILYHYPLGVELNLKSASWDATYKASKLFLELLFPIHGKEVKNVFTGEMVNVWGWLDFFIRIIAPYFIYYFIRGTRKFNLSI